MEVLRQARAHLPASGESARSYPALAGIAGISMRECDAEPADGYQTRSGGVFGNLGLSDGEPYPIHWSAILGIGGSSPIPGRNQDTFGLAYYLFGELLPGF